MCLDVYKTVLLMCLKYKRDLVVVERESNVGFGCLSCAI